MQALTDASRDAIKPKGRDQCRGLFCFHHLSRWSLAARFRLRPGLAFRARFRTRLRLALRRSLGPRVILRTISNRPARLAWWS